MTKYFPLRSVAAACCISLSGCSAVGPDFHPPLAENDLPTQFAQQQRSAQADAPPLPSADVNDAQFWSQFGDPQLRQLVQQALQNNNDLGAALARLQSAEALFQQSGWDRFPTVTMNAEGRQQKLSAAQTSPGQPRSARLYSSGITARWDLDFLGRISRSLEAAQASVQATQADVAGLQIIIAAQVADAYTQLRGAQLRLQIAQAAEDNQRSTLRLVERRLQAGSSTDLDAARARAQWLNTQARVPGLQTQIAAQQHRLAVLLGLPPDRLSAQLSSTSALPAISPALDPGAPAHLLRRRPDIAAAESRLHAATARIGVATADLFPRLSLGAVLGSITLAGRHLFASDTMQSAAFLGIDWSFLDVGRVRARIAASQADAAEALSLYQQSVLLALEETENALATLHRNRDELAALNEAQAERDQAERLAQRMYQGGAISLYEVLDAQREQLVAQDAQAQSQIAGVRASIALYKALAGGWTGLQQAGEEIAAQ
ncbi:MAG: efflux transporter outer membrane subunit [Comamonas sp.]|jgi:NodT family efflux transporter outer membrane factor (OMF) lipoprotein|nr:efflux transporter outer membrane subunit [Comamonas sp.]